MAPIPDSEIARQADRLLRGASEPFLVNHCLRSYLWGVALAEVEKVAFDAELLFVSAALHDLGLVPQFDTGAPFEHDSATAAHEFAQVHGSPPRKSAIAEQAIVLHVAPDITLDHGAEAYLLWHATAVDVTGSRLNELPTTIITQVLSNYPRLDFTAHFGKLFASQARRKPTSRAAQLVETGLLERLNACVLSQPSPGSRHRSPINPGEGWPRPDTPGRRCAGQGGSSRELIAPP